jgi:hypothetical protein
VKQPLMGMQQQQRSQSLSGSQKSPSHPLVIMQPNVSLVSLIHVTDALSSTDWTCLSRAAPAGHTVHVHKPVARAKQLPCSAGISLQQYRHCSFHTPRPKASKLSSSNVQRHQCLQCTGSS